MRGSGGLVVAATMQPPDRDDMPEYKTIEDTIGETPLVRLQRLPGAAQAERGVRISSAPNAFIVCARSIDRSSGMINSMR